MEQTPTTSIPMEINNQETVEVNPDITMPSVPEPDDVEIVTIYEEGSEEEGTGNKGHNGSLDDIKHRRSATADQMSLLISKVEEEFDNEIIRVQEETEKAVQEVQKYGEMVVAHVQSQRNEFVATVNAGLKEFEDVHQKTLKNIESLDFIQNQFSNTFRQTGLF